MGVVGGMRVTLRLPGASARALLCPVAAGLRGVRVQRHQSATAAVRPAQQFPRPGPGTFSAGPRMAAHPLPAARPASEWTRALAWHAPTCPGQRGLGLPLLGGPGGQWGQLGVAGTARLLQLLAGAARHGIATSPPLPECMEAPTMPLSPALVPPRQAWCPPTISISRRPGPKGHRPGHPPSKSPPHPTHGSP